MKKTKAGVMLSAVLIIALCVSLIAGTTFALFTSESSVDISVTSGKVNVQANVGEVTKSYDSQVVNSLNESLKAEYNEKTRILTLEGIIPGDIVEFNVDVTNNSTVAAKMRVKYLVEEGYLLASGLNIEITGLAESMTAGAYKAFSGKWEDAATKSVHVRITMPSTDYDNLYAGLNAKISFAVEAVQANGVDVNETVEPEMLPDYTELKTAYANGASVFKTSDGKWVNYEASLNDTLVVLTGNAVYTAEAAGIYYAGKNTIVELNGYTYSTNYGFLVGDDGDFTIQNGELVMDTPAPLYIGHTSLSKTGSLTLRNVDYTSTVGVTVLGKTENNQDPAKLLIDGCTFNVSYYAVSTNAESNGVWSNIDVEINNSVVNANQDCGIMFNVDGKMSINNTEITSKTQAIFARGGDITIKDSKLVSTAEQDNELDKWGSGTNANYGALIVGSKKNAAYKYDTTVTLENVELVAQHVSAIYVWGHTDYVSTVNYDENTMSKLQGQVFVGGSQVELDGTPLTHQDNQ